jgi:pimeloyl-ACP methyl ester carboxylesterase
MMTRSSSVVTGLRIACVIGLPLLLPACESAAETSEAEHDEALGTVESELHGQPPVRCERLTFPVALTEGQPATYHVAGWLCGRGSIQHRTIQVLLHGGTYSHIYWDFSYQPERYSYVRALTAAGYATLAIDRIGTGESDHPPALEVSAKSNAFVVHQIVQTLRSGTLHVPSFGRIRGERLMLVGHSLGTSVAIGEAATYHDVDGLILTGYLHNRGPGLVEFAQDFIPASSDPHFVGRDIPAGYLTTRPGARGASYFYYAPATDPAVIAADEATKETTTIGEAADFFTSAALSPQIDTPVLVVIGDRDRLFCDDPSCSAAGTVDREYAFYSPAARLQVVSIPLSSHILNLHKQAPLWYAIAATWSGLNVGVDTRRPPPLSGH